MEEVEGRTTIARTASACGQNQAAGKQRGRAVTALQNDQDLKVTGVWLSARGQLDQYVRANTLTATTAVGNVDSLMSS